MLRWQFETIILIHKDHLIFDKKILNNMTDYDIKDSGDSQQLERKKKESVARWQED